ncbi:MAG: alanine racemase [Nocardioides sp.]
MTLTLTIDGDRWRAHLSAVAQATPGLVPVAKGNGYGVGLGRRARTTQWRADQGLLGEDPVLAVGTYAELPEVATRCSADLLVLTPWRPFGPGLELDPTLAGRVIHTVGRPEDLRDLLARDPRARFVLELGTSMKRHGLAPHELRHTGLELADRPSARLAGVAVHLPLGTGTHLAEMERLLTDVVAAGLPAGSSTVWVSHLSTDELAQLRRAYPDLAVRPRIGTDLWLGDRGALRVTAPVLDVHAIERGERYGYRQRSAPRAGHLVIVSGGTAHGIGLEAPLGDGSLRSRATRLARGGLDAAGLAKSPYLIDRRHPFFAEPPHMQASMLFLPQGSSVPAVGDELELRVRFTATWVDRVVSS